MVPGQSARTLALDGVVEAGAGACLDVDAGAHRGWAATCGWTPSATSAALTSPAVRLAWRTEPVLGDAEPRLAHGLAGPLALAAAVRSGPAHLGPRHVARLLVA